MHGGRGFQEISMESDMSRNHNNAVLFFTTSPMWDHSLQKKWVLRTLGAAYRKKRVL